MENEQDAAAAAGVSRGQNQLHVLPEDWQSAASVIEPLLERIDADITSTPTPRLLVITNDIEAAAGVAGRIAGTAERRGLRVLAVTDNRRAARALRSSPPHVIVAPAAAIVGLMQSATLKLDGLRIVVLAWVDELSLAATRAFETLMTEVPKDAARIVIANAVTPAVEQLTERYARRAGRMQPTPADAAPPASLSYVTASESTRGAALRRILDAMDPESAFVVARDAASRSEVESLLRALGYGSDSSLVRVGESATDAKLVVLYDLPANESELRALVSERPSARVVAIVTPRQIAALRRLAGGVISPLVLPEAAARARTREEALRDEVRAALAAGQFSRELLALEPLLSDFDGAEIAAATLRLLEAERAKTHLPPTAVSQPPMTRLYLNVGSMDNVRPGDLVGAITSEAGISKAELGRVDVRERHSTIEVATPVANTVVSKITGVSIRNRRVLARVDEGPERPARPRGDDVRLGSREGRERKSGPPRDRNARPHRDRPRRNDA